MGAERVYCQDLEKNRSNGWALFGLVLKLHRRGATMGRAAVRRKSTVKYFALRKMYWFYGIYVMVCAWWACRGEWYWLPAWLALIPALHWMYIRVFPKLSRVLGRGPLQDERPTVVATTEGSVVLYYALGCPLSRIVARRLRTLQRRMGFSLKQIDVTFRPRILAQFGTYAVPVVEVDGWNLVGYATSARLSAFISESLRSQRRRQAFVEGATSAEPAKEKGRPVTRHSFSG